MALRGVKGLQQGLSQLKYTLCMPPVADSVQAPGPDKRRNQGSDLSSRPKRPALCSSLVQDLATTTSVLFSADLQCFCRPGLPRCDLLPLHKQHLPAINPRQALSNAGTTLPSATPTLRPCCLLS